MNTQTITIDFPSDILLALNETEDELKQGITNRQSSCKINSLG